MVTDKQKAAVHFCEQWLNITFEGDIEDKNQVLEFLEEYLQEAKTIYNEIKYEDFYTVVNKYIPKKMINYI